MAHASPSSSLISAADAILLLPRFLSDIFHFLNFSRQTWPSPEELAAVASVTVVPVRPRERKPATSSYLHAVTHQPEEQQDAAAVHDYATTAPVRHRRQYTVLRLPRARLRLLTLRVSFPVALSPFLA